MREVNEMLNYTCFLMINIVHELNMLIVFTFSSVFTPLIPVNNCTTMYMRQKHI